MRIIDPETEINEVRLTSLDVVPDLVVNRAIYDNYNRTRYLMDSILNIDIEKDGKESMDEFSTSMMNNDIDADFLMDSFEMLDAPGTLVEDIFSEDSDIALNGLEEMRLYIADSFLSDFNIDEVVDDIAMHHTHNQVVELGEELLNDEEYMADNFTIAKKCSAVKDMERYGDDGVKLVPRDTKIRTGKKTKTGKDAIINGCVWERPKNNPHSGQANPRGKSSPTRVRHAKPEYISTIKKATAKLNKDEKKKEKEGKSGKRKDDFFADNMHKARGTKIGRNGRCTSNQDRVLKRDKKGLRYLGCKVKPEKAGTIMRGRSSRLGKKISASAILKAQRTRAKREALGDYN